ncbi:MAG: hypothetical protein HOD99_11790, partial [Planctomycetaceae bacterium]|nr:hypothetical protein [Planctomycetaceae bacterium]
MAQSLNRIFLLLVITGYSAIIFSGEGFSEEVLDSSTVEQSEKTSDAQQKNPAVKKPVLIPGTGSLIKNGADTFEDENWKWYHRHPKSSREQDERMRSPLGKSNNGLWFEGPKRGTPDVVKRVELPAAGLEGSTHGLLVATLRAGIPGRVTYRMMQDDLIFNMSKAA